MNEESTQKKILDRLEKLEQHVTNLIYFMQDIRNSRVNTNPLTIDDRNLRSILSEFSKCMKKFSEDSKELDVSKAAAEIKFIGKRLHEIESILSKIQESGVEKQVNIGLTLDGYEMVKKKPCKADPIEIQFHEDKTSDAEPQELVVFDLLETLEERERTILIHRYALNGERKKTLDYLGSMLGISGGRVGQIEARSLRKLRHPTRKHLVEKLTHVALRKAITGK